MGLRDWLGSNRELDYAKPFPKFDLLSLFVLPHYDPVAENFSKRMVGSLRKINSMHFRRKPEKRRKEIDLGLRDNV